MIFCVIMQTFVLLFVMSARFSVWFVNYFGPMESLFLLHNILLVERQVKRKENMEGFDSAPKTGHLYSFILVLPVNTKLRHNILYLLPRRLDPLYFVSYYIKLSKTSWTHSKGQTVLLRIMFRRLMDNRIPIWLRDTDP